MKFPFLIRGPTNRLRIVNVHAHNYDNGLDRILSLYPNKFVKTKHAKAMVLIEAKEAAKKESKAQKGKTVYVYSDNATGEVDVTLTEKTNGKFTTLTTFVNGKEVKYMPEAEESNAPEKVKIEKVKLTKQSAAVENASTMGTKKKATKSSPKKEAKGDKVTRGNNMSLTASQWKKVDTKRGDVSFSAFSRNLVLKSIGE